MAATSQELNLKNLLMSLQHKKHSARQGGKPDKERKMRFYYENETAKKQLNDLGLFDKARKYMKIQGSKVYFDSRILSGHDHTGKAAGLCYCTIKPIVIAELQGLIFRS